MTEAKEEAIRILECEGCGVFFSCKCTREGFCDGLKLYRVTDIGRVTKEEVDLSTFKVVFYGDGLMNVTAFDKRHIYERVIEGRCFCAKCSGSTRAIDCGKVETINWEHRPVKKFKLHRRWVIPYEILEAYDDKEVLRGKLRAEIEKIERLKSELKCQKEKGKQ